MNLLIEDKMNTSYNISDFDFHLYTKQQKTFTGQYKHLTVSIWTIEDTYDIYNEIWFEFETYCPILTVINLWWCHDNFTFCEFSWSEHVY